MSVKEYLRLCFISGWWQHRKCSPWWGEWNSCRPYCRGPWAIIHCWWTHRSRGEGPSAAPARVFPPGGDERGSAGEPGLEPWHQLQQPRRHCPTLLQRFRFHRHAVSDHRLYRKQAVRSVFQFTQKGLGVGICRHSVADCRVFGRRGVEQVCQSPSQRPGRGWLSLVNCGGGGGWGQR